MVLYSAYQDPRPSEWLSKNAGIRGQDPFTSAAATAAKDLFGSSTTPSPASRGRREAA